MTDQPPLRPLHPEAILSRPKIATFEKVSTDRLLESLQPGRAHCLKCRTD